MTPASQIPRSVPDGIHAAASGGAHTPSPSRAFVEPLAPSASADAIAGGAAPDERGYATELAWAAHKLKAEASDDAAFDELRLATLCIGDAGLAEQTTDLINAFAGNGSARNRYLLRSLQRDYVGTAQSLQRLADGGDATAQFAYARLCMHWAATDELGIKPNILEAMRYLQLAKEQGHRGASTDLGYLHLRNVRALPVPAIDEAYHCLQKSASAGDARAYYLIGEMLEHGRIPRPLADKALPDELRKPDFFYSRAAESNFAPALIALRQLHRRMTTPQINGARSVATGRHIALEEMHPRPAGVLAPYAPDPEPLEIPEDLEPVGYDATIYPVPQLRAFADELIREYRYPE